jgi:ketosteroid isomerase-like protein
VENPENMSQADEHQVSQILEQWATATRKNQRDAILGEDLVRATFCLEKSAGAWRITHQHVSKPLQPSSAP